MSVSQITTIAAKGHPYAVSPLTRSPRATAAHFAGKRAGVMAPHHNAGASDFDGDEPSPLWLKACLCLFALGLAHLGVWSVQLIAHLSIVAKYGA